MLVRGKTGFTVSVVGVVLVTRLAVEGAWINEDTPSLKVLLKWRQLIKHSCQTLVTSSFPKGLTNT